MLNGSRKSKRKGAEQGFSPKGLKIEIGKWKFSSPQMPHLTAIDGRIEVLLPRNSSTAL